VDEAPALAFLLSSHRCVTRGDVADRRDALTVAIRTRNITRLLIKTPDSVTIVAGMAAGEACDVPVVLAHPNVGDDVRELCRRIGANAFVDDTAHVVPVEAAATGDPDGFSVSLMTSGTTGRPKLVRHSVESLTAATRVARTTLGADDRWLLTYQPTTFAGLQVILTAVCSQAALVTATGRTPAEFVEAAASFAATHISGTPTFWRSFLLASLGRELPRLRQITLGGEAVDQPTLDRLASRFPSARITHVYASTEAGSLFAVHDRRAGFPAAWLTGVRTAGVTLRVRDGVLEVRSPRRTAGLVGGMAPTISDDGWLVTGDLVRVEGDRIYFQGRTDDVINVGGGKVYPQEIEEFLLSCAGVIEARVRGVSNPISGTILAAEVILDGGEDPAWRRIELLRLCQANLPAHKAPRLVRVVKEIASHDSGKKA
jgi:acyl-coenzyme A synthetase/AMP-(fatty) acid ligase